jgi:hypothetical protein
VIQRQEVTDVLLAAFAAMGFALSARALLFVSIVGAIVLAVMSMRSQTFIVLAIYCCLTTIPLVVLELLAKRNV